MSLPSGLIAPTNCAKSKKRYLYNSAATTEDQPLRFAVTASLVFHICWSCPSPSPDIGHPDAFGSPVVV